MDVSSLILKLLSTYTGREKVLRAATYIPLLATGVARSEKSQIKLKILAAQFSGCRTVLRLLDDLPYWNVVIQQGLGKKDESPLDRALGCVSRWSILLFYPLEHVAWAADHKLLKVKNTQTLWRLSITCWLIHLLSSLIRSLRELKKCANNKEKSLKLSHLIPILSLTSDLILAIHWQSDVYLWGGRLKPWQVGLAGTISSFIGLAKCV